MIQSTEIIGCINEARRAFVGETTTGHVDFGRTWRNDKSKIPLQSVRVKLEDGRRAYGTYTDPKSVKLIIRK